MTSSKILFYLSLSFIVGIFLESVISIQGGPASGGKIPQFVLWVFLFIAVLLIFKQFVIRGNPLLIRVNPLIMGFCILFLVLGILRLQISEFNIAGDELSKLNDKGEISLTGVIIGEPDVKDTSQKLKIKTYDFGSTVLATTNRYPEYKYLDEVKITGKLETPIETEEFSYRNYLLKDHIYSVMYFSKIETTGKASGDPSFAKALAGKPFSAIYSGILWLKAKMRQSIRISFLPPHSSILEGVILGNKSAIPQEVKDKFRITGLSHIIAISGMHVVILSSIVMYFLLFLGFWRNQAFYGAVIFILVYIVLVGLPSSAVRAGIMGIIYLLGQKIGRQAMSLRVIVLAAGLMLLLNPLFLFYDVGFQLSFLAVLGLILFEPILRNFIKFLAFIFFRIKFKEKYENFLMLFTVTISAQIFTLPIIIYNFGNISFVSIFTNILVLPVVPGIMLFGFLSALAGVIFSFLGWLLSLPCYFLLIYVFWVVDIFVGPWAYKIIPDVSWVWAAVSYVFLGIAIRYSNKKLRMKFLDY